mgnify:FL=1
MNRMEQGAVECEKANLRDYAALLYWQAQRRPQKQALIVDERAFTYAELWRRVAGMAAMAMALGVRGDVLVAADTFVDQFTAFLALQAVRARPILLHHGLSAEEVQSILKENGLQGIWHCSREGAPLFEPSGLAERVHEEPDILGVLSSGSTGTPKVLYRTYRSWAGFFPVQDEVFHVCESTVLFLQGSLSFTGNTNTLLSVLYEGGTVVTSALLRCHLWEALLRRHAVDCIYLVPSKLQLLGQVLKESVATVRTIFTGSQLLTPSMLRRLKAVFPQAEILLYYGASELNYITYAICDDPDRDSRNLGRPFPGIAVEIGADGLIYVTTPYHISGVTMPFSVKDTGAINARGELIFGGRRAAWINKGGFKISTLRLELLLKAVLGVEDAAVLPVHEECRGDGAAAFLVAARGASPADIRRAVRRSLLPVEVPDRIVFLPALPLNDRGKVDRHQLERALEQARSHEKRKMQNGLTRAGEAHIIKPSTQATSDAKDMAAEDTSYREEHDG